MRLFFALFATFIFVCPVALPAHASDADPEISPVQYGGLYALKQAAPQFFKEKLLPLIEKAMKDGKITRSELESIEAATPSVGPAFLKAARERSLEEKFQDVMSKAEATGTDLTDSLGRALQSGQFNNFLDNTMNRLLPKTEQAPAKKPASPEAPVEL